MSEPKNPDTFLCPARDHAHIWWRINPVGDSQSFGFKVDKSANVTISEESLTYLLRLAGYKP